VERKRGQLPFGLLEEIIDKPATKPTYRWDVIMDNTEQPLDAKEALMHIRSLARATLNNDDAKLARQHMEMILMLVDRALPPRKRQA
jgi:hypothetical protein